MDVKEYDSPSESYCKNCDINIGCKIYSERKEVCHSFGCLWWYEKSMPTFLRPDICGILIEILPNNIFLAYIDQSKKDVLKNKETHTLLDKCIRAGHPVVVYNGKKAPLLYRLPDGISSEYVYTELLKFASHIGFK